MNSKKTLLGKSLVITRSLEQSESLSSELINMGAKVILIPLITITDPIDGGKGLEEKVKNFDSYKWVIVTSPNGAIRLLEKVKVYGKNHWPRIAVIGESTAEVFKQSGITVDLIPEKTFSEGFLEVFPNPEEEDDKVEDVVMVPLHQKYTLNIQKAKKKLVLIARLSCFFKANTKLI